MRTFLLISLSCWITTQADNACRCAERTLADYYAAADEVFLGTLVDTLPFGQDQREFRFEVEGEPFRSSAATDATLPFVSPTSSAACAIAAEPGATYVVFAEHDLDGGVAWLTGCNGTRIHRATDGTMAGFVDVPERFVVSQLTALSGMDALGAIAAVEADAGDPDNETLVGLLDVAAFTHAPEIPLFESARPNSSIVARVESYEAIDHRESGYEVDAAVVYATVDGWYKVRMAEGAFAWLAPDAAGTWWPLETLLPTRLAYLTADWNRLVWPELGAGIPTRLSYPGEERPREQAVEVLTTQRIGGSLWLEVRVLESSPCEGGPERVLAQGWVPAYGESGAPVAWYYSRGC